MASSKSSSPLITDPPQELEPLTLFGVGGAASVRKNDIVTAWGEEAVALLEAITTGEYRKKRRTLLALAHAAHSGTSFGKVFALNSSYTGSRTVHYEKWMRDDPAYRQAFEYLCGTRVTPGLALRKRDAEFAEEELAALAALERSRLKLQFLSEVAVDTLESAMGAADAAWGDRVRAAKEVLDRAPETAPLQRIQDDARPADDGGVARVMALLDRARARRDTDPPGAPATAPDS